MKADKGKPWYGAYGREVSPFCVQWKPPALLLVSGLSTTSLQLAFHGSNRVELPKHGWEEILPPSPKLLDSLLVAEQTEYMMNQQFPACEINVRSEIGLPCNPPSYYHLLLANTHTLKQFLQATRIWMGKILSNRNSTVLGVKQTWIQVSGLIWNLKQVISAPSVSSYIYEMGPPET